MSEVIWVTLQQKLVPGHLLGRVISIDWLVSLTLQPVGVALAAPVAGAIGVSGTFVAGATLSITAMALGMAHPEVRDPSEDSERT